MSQKPSIHDLDLEARNAPPETGPCVRDFPPKKPDPTQPCRLCRGTGWVTEDLRPILEEPIEVKCPACDGTGRLETGHSSK